MNESPFLVYFTFMLFEVHRCAFATWSPEGLLAKLEGESAFSMP